MAVAIIVVLVVVLIAYIGWPGITALGVAAAASGAKEMFYQQYQHESFPKSNNPSILFYNVHYFEDLQGSSSESKVVSLIRHYMPTIVVMAECVSPAVDRVLDRCGYENIVKASNGMSTDDLQLVVASWDPLRNTRVINTDVAGTQRKQIAFTMADGKRGVAVHLEIGDRCTDSQCKAKNSGTRTRQLEQILALDSPDFIIGDFNFTLDDPERKFLEIRGYRPMSTGSEKSTPYNRVDFCFTRVPLGRNQLVQCNYSDHLPMLQETMDIYTN